MRDARALPFASPQRRHPAWPQARTAAGAAGSTPTKVTASSLRALCLADPSPVPLPLWVGTERSPHLSQNPLLSCGGAWDHFCRAAGKRTCRFHQGWKTYFPLLTGMQTTLRVIQMLILALSGIWVLGCPSPVLRGSPVICDPHDGTGRCQWRHFPCSWAAASTGEPL